MLVDLPGVVSGETVGFLDPHEKYFGRRDSGQSYDIRAGLLQPKLKDQFTPFHGIFGCDLSSKRSYPGTLFRFPLRNMPSELSKKQYTASMIENLFTSLREEASVILLFLKSVQSICIYKRKNDDGVDCVFKVEVSNDTQDEVKRKRQELLQLAKQPSRISESKWIVSIHITSASQSRNFRWLVVNQIGSNEKRITELCAKLCLLPWIGFAVSTSTQASNEGIGRIFCFLPLPPDVDCQTGLPVHVHGYFGLTDNRRGLTWPGAECQNNETAEWNQLLLTKIGSAVYCKLLEALVTNQPDIGVSQEERSRLVYSTLPLLENVRGHWRSILEPLFRKLLYQRLFYALHISRNSWVTLNDGILDCLQESSTTAETRSVVLRFLQERSQVVITNLPPHVLKIVKTYFSSPKVITPALVRAVLKNSDVTMTSRQDKLRLLEYVLRDDQTSDITGVPLLPLANGHFTTFRRHQHVSNSKISIFVPSGNCTATLLPNMSDRFLDESLPEAIKTKLHRIAAPKTRNTHPTQLVRLTKDLVIENVRASLPSEWFSWACEKVSWNPGKSNHPPKEWLEAVWTWINSSFPIPLAHFQGIPLIPTDKCLGVLSQNSKFIFASIGSENPLPSQILTLLTTCGCTVLSNIPVYVHHPEINSYIAPPTPAGVLTVLSRVSLSTVQAQIIQMSTPADRSVLRDFLCRLPTTITDFQKNLLLQLPLFDNLHGSRTAVKTDGANLLKAASSDFNPPTGFQLSKGYLVLSCTNASTLKLLQLMKVEILKPADVLIQYLFPDISANHVYNSQQVTLIMQWILERMVIFNSQNKVFLEYLKTLPFVLTQSGKRKRPAELYDPYDPVLRNLLAGETDVFPTGVFALENAISKLKLLNLRTRTTLAAADLYRCAQGISSSRPSPLSTKKVMALVEILKDDSSYLSRPLTRHSTLKEQLCQLKWIPCASNPPQNYPHFVPWYNNPNFFRPSEIRSSSKALLIGSSMPTLGINMNLRLQEEFGLTCNPPIVNVSNQLKIAITSWQRCEGKTTSMDVAKFEGMLTDIYLYLSTFSQQCVASALEGESLREWIWHGNGFCLPRNVALRKDFALDLRPRLFLLQNEFKRNSTLASFFVQHGVREKFSDEDILHVLQGIREKHASLEQNFPNEVEQDLELCLAILQWVVKDGNALPESLQETVFVPVQSPNNMLVLEACKKCTYCDRDWLRLGGSELDIPGNYQIIHDAVSEKVARLLGVPPLSTCLLSAETLGFEQTGPYEPITTRLNNILKEYKEGVGVFKELIQNADDAGATKVRFLVDWRYGPTKKLLSSKMEECQGPALWAYNNAVFTDKDFENINKLAGATKLKDVGKIGRFGLGFNAVYHLTDVPSFVSREYFVVFDPNVNHLQSHIKDKSRPGIRINLATNPRPLTAFEDQFQPYHQVFDCNAKVTSSEKFRFDGTLFRFPFRTLKEAGESEICQSVYSKEKVKQVVSSLRESSALLLLFTQHVKQVELYEIEKDCDPSRMQLVLSVTKNTPRPIRHGNSSCSQPFIKDCSNWWREKLGSSLSPIKSSITGPSRCELVEIVKEEMVSDLIKTGQQSVDHKAWLLTSSVGTDSSVCLASGEGRQHGLLPCGGAAARLSCAPSKQPGVFSYSHIEPVAGEAFCFLPLSIPTGFPVHVNGFFAITSNRRGIWEKTTSRQGQPIEVRWNECLLEDVLSCAYVQMLKDLKSLSESGQLKGYTFDILWPVYDTLHSTTWGKLVNSVYTNLVKQSLPLFCSDGRWLTIQDGYFLDKHLRKIPEVIETLEFLKENVFHVRSEVFTSLVKSDQRETFQQRTLNLKTFLTNLFFPNVSNIPHTIRDPVVCHVLDYILRGNHEFAWPFYEHPCITCSKDGSHLAKPCELVNPVGPAANLFSAEDHRFPVGEHFLTKNRIHALEQLGMVKDLVSWHEICGRAESVKRVAVMSYDKGRERARNLIKYLKENLDNLPKAEAEVLSILRRTEFLPFVFKPPDGYCLPWKGAKCNKSQFFAPNSIFMSSDVYLVGSCSSVVDDSEDTGCGKLGHRVKDLLGFSSRLPLAEQVLHQLDAAIESCVEGSCNLRDKKDTMESVCKRVYRYFNVLVTKALQRNVELEQKKQKQQDAVLTVQWLLKELNQRAWIFIQGQFVSSEKVAYNWSGKGAPYLYGLPYEYVGKYDNLLNMAGVKQFFHASDFICALYALKDAKKGSPLTNEELKLAVGFLSELKGKDNLTTHVGQIPLPDTAKLLCRSDDLTINMTFWLKDRGDARYVHEDIPPQLALELGAKSLQNRRLKKYSNAVGSPFGQHEKLTDRLKNILKSYPCDSGILKELVQNADDAEATEIHFIYDTRQLPHESVFQTHAEEVQGPALCVYNNRPFSSKDLEGIQRLGIGSKGDNPEKTGQYGIGFNAVYHLTDCPSFLSNEDTLCVLDPHCRYAPEATLESPGEQFQPIDKEFKEDFKDVLLGYLGEYFALKDATMFRLPLRTLQRSQESLISNTCASNYKVRELLNTFKSEAKKMLLFLNHIKKISLSDVDEHGLLKPTYEVVAVMQKESEQRRRQISHFMRRYKNRPTKEVPWEGITFPITLSDSNEVVEKWLVHQCCGTKCRDEAEVPDGHRYGLFPRGGVAALVSSSQNLTREDQRRYVAYCFLPLPVYTSLPVHVNGHFALDSSRRNLWHDTDPNGPLTKWNDFMKSQVLAPGYASLICEARKYIPFSEKHAQNDTNCWFFNFTHAKRGLEWYHRLFPHTSEQSTWNILACELYRFLQATRAPTLPIVVADDAREVSMTASQRQQDTLHRIRDWLPVQDVFFLDSKEPLSEDRDRLLELLLRINLPLLVHSPPSIHLAFQKAGVTSKVLSPMSLIDFLRTFKSPNSTCKIGQLPSKLEDTNIRTILRLKALIDCCEKEESFSSLLEGLPLLLTADGVLRIFQSSYPVYLSKFSDLFPAEARWFIHPDFVYKLPEIEKLPMPQVMRRFTVDSLAQYLPNTFPPNMRSVNVHVPWVFPEKGLLSKEWFKRLWNFLENHAKPEHDQKHVSLEPLGEWPIIPTLCGKLVTVKNAKTVLDITQRKTETAQGRYVREVLKKLGCPSLNTDITLKKLVSRSAGLYESISFASNMFALRSIGTGSPSVDLDDGKTHVTDPYVAHPYSVRDVLQVLHYMRKADILNISKIKAEEIHKMLTFFQEELPRLEPKHKFIEILKGLPFYKAINGTHFSLLSFSFYAVIPVGVPAEEIGKVQDHTGCLFLHADAAVDLDLLYKALGVGVENSLSAFYRKYILPSFKIFSRESQIQYLRHIRDIVLPSLVIGTSLKQERQVFLNFLTASPCLPDQYGNLHHAREFHDPRNEVFRMMFDGNSNQFPPKPFQEQDWLEFLSEIGLRTMVPEIQFLEFCKEVASVAEESPEDAKIAEKSKVLVQYLFISQHLRSENFLCSVAGIRFIASEKVEPGLLSLNNQYQCNKKGENPPFVKFLNAVPWKFRVLTWTSAELLPSWGKPRENLIHLLGVQEVPTVDTVVTHLLNISCTLAEITKKDEILPRSKLLKDIMVNIYTFLNKSIECGKKEISDCCSEECRITGDRLKTVPCVLVEDGKVLVKGDQLSFMVHGWNLYHPFLYTVPREYGPFEHLMKRLGATEQLTSLQLASILKAMKSQCKDDRMNPNFIEKARTAMGELFQCVYSESKCGKEASMISHLNELFLPSEGERLIKANELVCKIPPRLSTKMANLKYHVLFPMEKCGLRREQEDAYLNALPLHLRPRPLNSLFREVLDSSCLCDTCPLCQENSSCDFIKSYTLILQSSEFQEGIVRLLKHQKKSNELTEKEKEGSSRFGSSQLEVKCMKNIKVHFVDVETEEPLENSSTTRSCYVVEKSDSWTLLIQHGNSGCSQAILPSCINRILGGCLSEACLLAVANMVLCDSPAQISDVLNDLDVAQNFTEEVHKLGREVPSVFHHLMQQNPLFLFHEGEIVAYGIEMIAEQGIENKEEQDGTHSEETTPMKYVLGKVITRTDKPTEDEASYDFRAQYLIDIGSEQKMVSVLDLYKFYQNNFEENLTTDLVSFTGDSSKKPIDMDGAKREILRALGDAWRLPHELRRKVIRRLFLQWHPDKNPHNAKFATEVMKFLLSEVKRMEQEESGVNGTAGSYGFSGLFQGWGRQARRDRETYQNYRRCYGVSRGSVFGASDYSFPNPLESQRWIKQAQRDLEAAEFLLTAPKSFDALVCFVSHQTVEKCLKAALYAKCGLNGDQLHTHDVYKLATYVSGLENARHCIVDLAVVVGNYYLPTRYPNRQPGSIIPADAFNGEQARKAVQAAKRLLEIVEAFIIED